jgi:Flp pilus assembly secretin CpaC
MTLDNTEAIFDSTDKIPVPKVNNAGLGVSTVSTEDKEIPLTIKVKPQLNKVSNFIKLDIKAKVGDITNRALPKAVQDIAVATIVRSAETSVMVADSDTVVLGGLIRDKTTEVINKVPLLGDIPILGWLFKSRASTVEKSNLMIFITPRIMRQPENVRMVLDKKLKERDEFVEKAFGGEDYHREARNRIIRDLPDTKSIKNYSGSVKKVEAIEGDDEKSDSKKDEKDGKTGETMKDSHETLTLPPVEPAPPPAAAVSEAPPPPPPPAPGSIPSDGAPQ